MLCSIGTSLFTDPFGSHALFGPEHIVYTHSILSEEAYLQHFINYSQTCIASHIPSHQCLLVQNAELGILSPELRLSNPVVKDEIHMRPCQIEKPMKSSHVAPEQGGIGNADLTQCEAFNTL